jgi:hypothetical protein
MLIETCTVRVVEWPGDRNDWLRHRPSWWPLRLRWSVYSDWLSDGTRGVMMPERRRPPKRATHETRLTITRDQLRAALAAVFYPAMPDWDETGQARIDRATQRLIEAVRR